MKRKLFLISLIISGASVSFAQSSYEEFVNKMNKDYGTFVNKANEDYESFRNKANEDYAKFLEKSWNDYKATKPLKGKDRTPTPPVIYDNEPVKDNTKPIKEVVKPTPPPTPQPLPVEPIKEIPKINRWFGFTFYGYNLKVRLSEEHKFNIGKITEKNIAAAWNTLSQEKYNNVINDCLNIRDNNRLCDWAYLLMIQEMAEAFAGKASNEATLLMAYVYCQSGYKMRLGFEDDRLYMLYASKHYIYDISHYNLDGEKFYPLDFEGSYLRISEVAFPKEQALSLNVPQVPLIGAEHTQQRDLQSNRYPNASATISSNVALIAFYNTYPTSQIDGNFMTRWAMYANTPLSPQAEESLYPSLRRAIEGVSQLEAVNRILNFVQTAFTYKLDKNVWGDDRAFFADETLFYPYCDCEDRSILFSRIVRDLVGLEVVLVYYPEHLATAVHFTTDVKGDNFMLDGKKFVVCDPTYINALVGATMPQFRGNTDISVIPLDPPANPAQ